ncbi:MAG: hypothetical protein LBM73_01855 [Candidatus Nomurabacteria bacterium]|jgi:hypothetical protein|nr:hypothetical protein [Candidatus Nomurabacteria bacterium]
MAIENSAAAAAKSSETFEKPSRFPRAKKFVEDHGLTVFVILALIIAGVLVGVALTLYKTSGADKIDLSRPGYESVRKDIQPDDATDSDYPTNGNLDQNALDDFQKRFGKEQSNLNQLDNFGSDALSDESLGLK